MVLAAAETPAVMASPVESELPPLMLATVVSVTPAGLA